MQDASANKPWYEIVAALAPLIIGICVTGAGVIFAALHNSRQLQLNQLMALDKFRELLVSAKDADRAFAYTSFEAIGYKDLALKIIEANRDGAGRAIVQSIQKTGSEQQQEEAKKVLPSIPARVYIHVAEGGQVNLGNMLGERLAKAGYSFRGVEKVRVVPNSTQVRFFNQDDKPIAQEIVEELKLSGISDAKVSEFGSYEVRPGSLEIWLSKDIGG